MSKGLYFYKLVSPYKEDVTKGCKLTVTEIDSNFLSLKDEDIATAEFERESKTLVLTRNDGDKLIVPLDDAAYDLDVKADFGESGTTLTISYDGKDGKQEVTIANILTADNLMSIIGSDILTKVITDGTLKGNGTMDSPLGLSGVWKSGMLAPAKEIVDLRNGDRLPEVAKLGTRYVTKEYVSDYGYLYNGAGVDKIKERLEADGRGWRVPSKADWDALLNSMEPCDYQDHNSARCHVELGKYAGKFLKSECGWLGEPDCDCTITKPATGCTYPTEDYVDVEGSEADSPIPSYSESTCEGVDKYGMTILPSGAGTIDTHRRPQTASFKEQAFFWTTTHVYNDDDQDVYVKEFDWDKCGVSQVAECPYPYYSVRLVKDYDGSNYFDTEYIDGIAYSTILFPQSGQIWLASNYASKQGFVEYESGGETPELWEVNNGEVIEKREELFINEWNGEYWEKRAMHEGDTIVIENPCFDGATGTTTTITWEDKHGEKHCIDVEIPKSAQSNIEYRVFTNDEDCDKELVNTDDLVVERVVNIIVPMIEQEREERIEADNALSGAIDTEREERILGDSQLWDTLMQEISDRTKVDDELWEAIIKEASARTETDNEIWEAIAKEASARTETDNQLWEALNKEIADRLAIEAQLWQGINGETERAQQVEAQLWEAINGETARAQDVEAQLWKALNDEIERAKAREDEIEGLTVVPSDDYVMNASVEDGPNLTLRTRDGIEEHFIKIKFDGNFGEI